MLRGLMMNPSSVSATKSDRVRALQSIFRRRLPRRLEIGPGDRLCYLLGGGEGSFWPHLNVQTNHH